ncbi:protein inturned-like [Branchiostoma lanceolatum]|uniref:protein inturned-like n=1 Tax=Branchiostoma lanceolatum TaxID=7740 RepID=UPI003453EE6A
MAEFDSIRIILAKCNVQSEWTKHVRPDGSLFYLEPELDPDPDRRLGTVGHKTDLDKRRRDSGIEDDLMRQKRKSSKIIKCVLRTLLRKRNGVKGQYTNGLNVEKKMNAVTNCAELQKFHVRLKVDPRGGGNLLDGVFPIEKLTRVDWLLEDRSDNQCSGKRIFVEDLPEYGALTRLSNLRRGDCISALNDISVTRGNLSSLLAAISQPMEVILTIERSQKASLRKRNAVHQLDAVPESSKDETHAQQSGSLFSSKWSNVNPRGRDGKAEMLIIKD